MTSQSGGVDSFDFFIKQRDTYPYLEATLTAMDGNENSTVIDVTGGTVRFNMMTEDRAATVISGGTCIILSGTAGYVRYPWSTVDTATAGIYYGEFSCALSSGASVTVPNDGHIKIAITSQIA